MCEKGQSLSQLKAVLAICGLECRRASECIDGALIAFRSPLPECDYALIVRDLIRNPARTSVRLVCAARDGNQKNEADNRTCGYLHQIIRDGGLFRDGGEI